MKTSNKIFTLLCMLALALTVRMLFTEKASAQATQPGTPVQQTATELRAAQIVGTSATSATTITLTPPGGQSVYVWEVDIQNCAGATAVAAAAPTTITSTNITGSLAFTVGSGVGAGLCTNQMVSYPFGLKSTTPGAAVTFVLPTFATNQTIRLNVAASYAQ